MKKSIAILIIFALLLLVPFTVGATVGAQKTEDISKKENVYETFKELSLDDNEKKAYDQIVKAILNMDSHVEIAREIVTNRDELDKIFDAIGVDHPEIFWYEDYSVKGFRKVVHLTYSYTKEEVDETKKMLEEIYKPIVSIVEEIEDENEKVEFIKETIKGTVYVPIENFTEVKSLMKGYSREFKYIMDLIGIKSIVNEVYIGKDNYEYYNFVFVNDTWYNIELPFTTQDDNAKIIEEFIEEDEEKAEEKNTKTEKENAEVEEDIIKPEKSDTETQKNTTKTVKGDTKADEETAKPEKDKTDSDEKSAKEDTNTVTESDKKSNTTPTKKVDETVKTK